MISKKIFQDDIPDSLLRDMLKRNLFFLVLIGIVAVLCCVFLYFSVLPNRYKAETKFYLTQNNQRVASSEEIHQYFIRLLKNDKTRNQLVNKYDLVYVYGVDTTQKYYQIELDKKLYDDLKVEEQMDGTILVSFVSNTQEKSIMIVKDLIKIGLNRINSFQVQKASNYYSFESLDGFKKNQVQPNFLIVLFLTTIPVMLISVIFIAVKEKIYLTLKTPKH